MHAHQYAAVRSCTRLVRASAVHRTTTTAPGPQRERTSDSTSRSAARAAATLMARRARILVTARAATCDDLSMSLLVEVERSGDDRDVLGLTLHLGAVGIGARVEDHRGHDVRIHVRRRAAVLEVAALVGLDRARDTDRAAAVGDAVAEVVDRRGLVRAGQPALVALAIGGDVLGVLGAKFADGGLDRRDATLRERVRVSE